MQKYFVEIEEGKVYLWTEIKQMGFDADRFVKNLSVGHIGILRTINFFEKTHFPGVSFELVQSTKKFRAFTNNFDHDKVVHLTIVRNLDYKIEILEKNLWSWKFDNTEPAKIVQLEEELSALKDELLTLIKRVR